uniref:MSP domain-containing protein n=1 Tax=Heterorhabditis bacteriophora TaxID=37862 RepID=A0A1I7XVU4_HETBA
MRQRSAETNPRSPTLLRDARGRAEKPWLQSYAPTNSRLSSSLSPNREWSAANAYDKIYGGADRTPSHSDPSRHVIESTTSFKTRTPSPTNIRSRHFAERQIQTPSPTRYERRYESPFSGHRNYSETSYRSPSPTTRNELRVNESPFRSTPSPGPGERIRKIEQIDPMAAEEERERRRVQDERERSKSVGYTVAQYGQPGMVTLERRHSQERSAVPRYFDENVENKRERDQAVVTSASDRVKRDESPEYSFVYEKFERKKDQSPAPVHGYLEKMPSPSIAKKKYEQEIRSGSPTPKYNIEPISRESTGISTTFKSGAEPSYIETTTIKTTMFSPPQRKAHEYENIDRKPEVPHRAIFPESHEGIESRRVQTVKTSVDKDLGFLRTQSEIQIMKVMDRDVSSSPLHRTEEKESIFVAPPDKISRSAGIPSIPLSEKQFRTAEYLRVKEEDDRILEKHGYVKRASQEPSIEIQEPASDIRDDVIEVAGSKDNLSAERGVDTPVRIQALEPVAELPHSPVPSTTTTPHTTPKPSMKFKRHEVVKRGKDVEVKLENLKLSKDDTLRFVVMPPIRNQIGNHSSIPQLPQPEIETKVKKSGSKYEISFRPTEVGTHKVFAYVNDIQHPLSPFNIRVYDASEIIVGEIPTQSSLNDTVEFTVDAGRAGFGNLEMAIKDADGVIIPSHVAQLESGTAKFLVTFTPATKGEHTVNITFNKEVLKNSPFEVNIIDMPVAESTDATISPSLSKKDLKKEKEDKKREEKERAKREKEEKAATLKKDKKVKTCNYVY